MLQTIIDALAARDDIQAWTVRHIQKRGAQLYAVRSTTEARRVVDNEYFSVDVLRETRGTDGAAACGAGSVTLLPGDDIGRALDAAALSAGLLRNPPYSVPAPAALPEVPLVDESLQADAEHALDSILESIQAQAARDPRVRLTAAECFAEEQTTRLVNSRGLDARQTATQVEVEWVLLSRNAEREVEAFGALARRRAADLGMDQAVAESAQYAVDLLDASEPPQYKGAVVLRGEALAAFLQGGLVNVPGPLQTHTSAAAKYQHLTRWEIGQSIFQGEVKGDPLTLWANRVAPYGSHSERFDDEGLPAQRVAVIRDNQLVAFTANQRYADYLGVAPTGAFGNTEVAAGSTPAAQLLSEPHVEIIAFSWFYPDNITGHFSSEIRLGYVVNGSRRVPFRGGLLIGNVFDALADVRWSAETGFFGMYLGPTTARFGELVVSGEE